MVMPVKDKFSAEIKLKVPFHDVDSAQVVWHGHYVKYFEMVRTELFNKLDYSYKKMEESGYFWPVVDMRIKYIKPLFFGQKILIRAHIKEWENRLKIEHVIRDAHTLEKSTKAYTIQVAFDIAKREMLYESPPVLKEALGIE
jgi:acyl-CoA thioester hydrolase